MPGRVWGQQHSAGLSWPHTQVMGRELKVPLDNSEVKTFSRTQPASESDEIPVSPGGWHVSLEGQDCAQSGRFAAGCWKWGLGSWFGGVALCLERGSAVQGRE